MKRQLIAIVLTIAGIVAALVIATGVLSLRPTAVSPLSSSLPTNSPIPTPTPDQWWSEPCNTPPLELSDSCAEITPIEQPAEQIPVPCIRTAYTETVTDNEYVDYRLIVLVDHPEYDSTPAIPIHILRLANGGWIVDREVMQFWDFDCGKDEAPLSWVTWQVLVTESLTPTEVYTTDLPAPFLDLLSDLQ